ncbi:EmrB/QacA subfamily drug resistance transporter [Scopulibacillus darangshiensis]|uniref:EmrB/QacA subfamily drug resistance transporter n=1 Tax=Scopulibacillus darangshiensis TaxID=442528 RepID=A0A4R2PBG5_9BACL|nr:MFS transporter [Scopulibacillus darangshiensis]TCP31245.1 EmrB/QacA subfamily drug resistance transporter [Scopulibacillus darangshiensis]
MTQTLKKPWLLIVTVALGTLLNPLNSSMIAVALTRMQEDFNLDFTDLSWLISTFYLASAVAQPVMGKLGDMFGYKRLFLMGLILVAAASVFAPMSPSYGLLLVFRMLQAVGSSALFPSGMAMIRASITKHQAKALSVLAVFSSTSAAFGPSIGGFLIHSWDWQAIFFINFPFIIASFLLSIFVLPGGRRVHIELKRIDFGGIALFIVSIVMILLFLLSFSGHIRWWTLLVAIVAVICFYFYEKRRKEPFIDLSSLKANVNVSFIYLQFILVNLIFYTIFFGIPTFLQQAQHYNERDTGLIMLAVAGFGVVISPAAGQWIDRSGSKPPLLVGAVTILAGTAMLLTVHDDTSIWWMIVVLSVFGISNGFNNISMQTALYSFVKAEETGSASGLFMTSRYMGTILSSSLIGIFFSEKINSSHLHIIAYICLAASLLILILTIRMPGTHRQRVIKGRAPRRNN